MTHRERPDASKGRQRSPTVEVGAGPPAPRRNHGRLTTSATAIGVAAVIALSIWALTGASAGYQNAAQARSSSGGTVGGGAQTGTGKARVLDGNGLGTA